MQTTLAHLLLQDVAAFEEARKGWMNPRDIRIDIDVTSELEGVIRQHSLIDTQVITDVMAHLHSSFTARPILLPIMRFPGGQIPHRLKVTIRLPSGPKELTVMSCRDLMAQVTPPAAAYEELTDSLLVEVDVHDLQTTLYLTVELTLDLHQPERRPSPFFGLLGLFDPVGWVTVDVPRDRQSSDSVVTFPPEVVADRAVVLMGTTIDGQLREVLGRCAQYPRHLPPEENFDEHMLRHIYAGLNHDLRRMAATLVSQHRILHRYGYDESNRRQLDDIEASAAVLIDLVSSLEAWLEARPPDQQSNQPPSLSDIAKMTKSAVDPVTALKLHRELHPAEAVAPGAHTLTYPPGMALRQIHIPFTLRSSSLVRRHLEIRASLAALAMILILLYWRLGIDNPLGPWGADTQTTRAEDLASSRDAVVAILVVFPALLYVRTDRIHTQRSLIVRRSVDVALWAASLAALLPVGVAVLALGDARPNLVMRGLATAAGVLVLTIVAVSIVFSEPCLEWFRKRACSKEVRA